MAKRPNIFTYEDYKKYINDYILFLPKSGRGMLSKIATFLDCHKSFVTVVLKGKKHFNVEQVYTVGQVLNLNENELEYLVILVQIEKATTSSLKEFFSRRKASLTVGFMNASSKRTVMSDEVRKIYFNEWFYSAIKLILSINDSKLLENELQKLNIEQSVIKDVITFLVEKEIIKKNENGSFSPQNKILIESDDYDLLKKHHVNWRNQSLKMIDSEKGYSENKYITCPMVLSEEDFRRLKESLVIFIGGVSKTISKTTAEKFCCLNIDFFCYRDSKENV